MAHTSEHTPHQSPAELIDTRFGFLAHPLELTPYQHKQHDSVMENAMDNRLVGEMLSVFNKNGDQGTKNHSLGVSWIVAAAALELGLEKRDATMLAVAGAIHDIEKGNPIISWVFNSRVKYADNPAMFRLGQRHAKWGEHKVSRLGSGPNIAMLVGSHHGFQTDRPAYGITADNVRAFEEPDGYVPPIKVMAEILASGDSTHALSVDPAVSGRLYLNKSDVSPARAMEVVNTLRVRDEVKRAIGKVVGYDELRDAA
ncbi:MAG: hypothetical protein JWP13_231 [Candidatus Saccharibacteria bacterium]|nr:hypothetical protein [Candidatus Saccharibacteria bacterium]